MANRIIDKQPPKPTGNPEKDAKAALEYMAYLREQMNYILTQIYKKE